MAVPAGGGQADQGAPAPPVRRARGRTFVRRPRRRAARRRSAIAMAGSSVNESAIMRWLGGLGASAFGDFSGRTELEENLFLYETFDALRKDVNRD